MNPHTYPGSRWRYTVLALAVMAPAILSAFPPAPHHTIRGMVRDEMGSPLSLQSAQVYVETPNGISIATQVSAQIQPGENYQLRIPMDSLTSVQPYKSTALTATAPFRLKVRIGETDYLPIEMVGDFRSLGKPAGESIINLTLGVDSDGDGMPDAWEELIVQLLGGGLTLADIDPDGDNDGDGSSNFSEYVAGTYAFDPADRLQLKLVRGAGPQATSSLADPAGGQPQRFYRVIQVDAPPRAVPASLAVAKGVAKVSWGALGGRTYRVQYKDDLSDPDWSDMSSDVTTSGPVLQFFAVAGRTYSIQGTSNMSDWLPLKFRVPAGSSAAAGVSHYYAGTGGTREAEVLFDESQPEACFFRLQVR